MQAEPIAPRPRPPPTTRPRLRFWIVAVGAVLLVAFAASSALDVRRSYRQSLAATERELANLAKALAEQATHSLQTIDVLLRDTAEWYATAGDRATPEQVHDALVGRAAGLPQVRALSIVDPGGVRRHSSIAAADTTARDVSDRSYFIAQRDASAAGLFMSEPIITRSHGRVALVLSRRIDAHGKRFGGIVSATVDVDDLQHFYRAINLGPGSAVNVLHDDGALVVRQPPIPGAVGRDFAEFAAARALVGEDQPATLLVSPVDGVRRFVAIARVRDLPLAVMVTRDAAIALQPWSGETVHVAVRTLALTALGALLIAALVQQLARVEAGERALRESEERYALAMAGSNEGHWDWDLVTDRAFLSPNMKALHGRAEDDAVTTRTDWFARVEVDPDDRLRLEAAARNHLDGRTSSYEVEYRVRHPDGEWHWLLARGRCLRDAAGTPYRLVGSTSDITARKRAESEKERLAVELRQSQKMEAMGTLAGGIAHDFNNILGAILGYGELAQKHSSEESTVRRYLAQVMHAGGRAKALVERILAFSRSGLGERVPVHVQAVVEETLELLTPSLPSRVQVKRKFDAGNAAVIGDVTQLHQVVMNLCTNAVHAMDHRGTLTVVLERIAVSVRRPLSHGMLSPRSYVRLAVSDTGDGIPPAVLERMFDPFFTTKAVGEGTGLGLSLVHGIVTDLDGAIDVATELGAGTTFAVWLPITGETPRPVTEEDRELPRGNGESVMVVDDERSLVMLAEETLAELGYEPIGFESSVAALRAFRSDPDRYDLVLTDETMPDLSGIELAREMRRLRPGLPVILMSGYSGPQLAERARHAGVIDVLRKPLQRRDIAESLARTLIAL